MRIAAIDIGTNSVHMIVVQVRPDRSFEVVDREKEMVRLGSGGLGGRALTESATASALQALSKFRRLAESHDVDEIVAAATSAVREADNGREFLNAIQQRTGIRARVISGAEEAKLIHRAAVYGVDFAGGPAVVIDIGGGSVELTRGTASRIHVAHSAKIGVIRLTEQFVRTDPISVRDQRRMTAFVNEEIAAVVDRIVKLGFKRVIGTSGTILSLGALAAANGQPPASDALRNRRVPTKQIRRVRRELSGMPLADRLRIPGLDPRRADLAVAGAIVLDAILKRLRARDITLCDLALREGLALDYIRRNRAQIANIEKYPDVRRRSVFELAERCSYAREHSRQVARLALELFDQTRPAHGLDSRAREWLEYAALLHDIGVHISHARHHRHSYYLVKNGDLRGFEPEEVEIMALTARYHRRGRPRRSHEGYGQLGGAARRTVRTLGAILRVAENLDRSQQQSVASLTVVPGAQDYLVRLKPDGDTELEVWAAQRAVAPLARALRRIIRFEVAPGRGARATAPRRPRARSSEPPRRARAGLPAALALAAALLPGGGAQAQEMPELVADGARVERIADGFAFVEGPAVDADGALYFSDIPNNRIHRWTPDEGVTTVREMSGGANGLRFDADGALIACEMRNRRVAVIDPAGGGQVLAERYEGGRFNSPNDLWIDAQGGIYFTDPRYGPDDDLEQDGQHVYYLTPDRTAVRRVADDLERPNGVIGSPDGERLYVADHGAGRTWVYTPGADGALGGKRLFAAQGSDGMTMDERGNVYLTGEDVTILDPDGRVVGSIAVPEAPANLTFGGPDGRTLFITARTSVYAVRMTVSGQ